MQYWAHDVRIIAPFLWIDFMPMELLSSTPVTVTRTIRPLKGYRAFDAVFKNGSRFAYQGLTGFIVFQNVLETALRNSAHTEQDIALIRLAQAYHHSPDTLIVGVSAKRHTRPAVMRNRLKRLLRAGIHKLIIQEQQSSMGIAAIVLICNIIPEKPSLLVLDDILPQLRRIIQNADKYYRSRHSHKSIVLTENTAKPTNSSPQ